MTERLFKAEMVLYGDDLSSLSEYLEMTRQTLSRKIKEGSFSQEEMSKIKSRYNLSSEKFVQIFTEGVVTNESERSGTKAQ